MGSTWVSSKLFFHPKVKIWHPVSLANIRLLELPKNLNRVNVGAGVGAVDVDEKGLSIFPHQMDRQAWFAHFDHGLKNSLKLLDQKLWSILVWNLGDIRTLINRDLQWKYTRQKYCGLLWKKISYQEHDFRSNSAEILKYLSSKNYLKIYLRALIHEPGWTLRPRGL